MKDFEGQKQLKSNYPPVKINNFKNLKKKFNIDTSVRFKVYVFSDR